MRPFIKTISAAEAVKAVKSEDRIFIHGSAATPLHLIKALMARTSDLKNVELTGITTLAGELFNEEENFRNSFFINSLFVSSDSRKLINSGNGDYIPVFLSEIPKLFDKGLLNLDVAFIHISPPDKHGFCSLGTSVDIARSAVRNAKHVIAQVNPKMPRTLGDGIIHINDINSFVDIDEPLQEINYSKDINPVSKAIGKYCSDLIEDGSTLQLGIGSIPDAVLSELRNHKDLGIHTEMFSDGIIPLVEKGIINNKFKKKHRGKLVTSFAVGTKKLYDFVDDNPQVTFLEIDYVNDEKIIRANPKVVAINSALEIDLTGQVCADSLGTYQYSGVGGQMDFIRGAALSEGGKPIIAMPSVTSKGESRIVPFLKQGAGVVTTRAHVHYIITEYGVAYLYGKNLFQRATELLKIANPIHQEYLDKEIFKRFGRKLF